METVKRHHSRTFVAVEEDILSQLKNSREIMTKNRKDNINFIENNLEPSIKSYDLLNYENLTKNWNKIEGIMMKKLATI